MTERPILFSAPMVSALLEGRKTQTRRLVKWNNRSGVNLRFSGLSLDHSSPDRWELLSRDGDARWNERAFARCPYGKPGDRLWVRETFSREWKVDPTCTAIAYRADGLMFDDDYRWKPSIFMRRADSRITLEITEVRAQRLQEISEEDAAAEGVTANWSSPYWEGYETRPDGRRMHFSTGCGQDGTAGPPSDIEAPYRCPSSLLSSARDNFRYLWRSINGLGSWDANPWVWAVTFRRIT